MRKIKKVLKIALVIVIVIVTLCGCSQEQLERWNEITHISSDTADGNPDVDAEYVNACKAKATALAKKEVSLQDMQGEIRYFEIEEDGNGIAVFPNSIGDNSETSDNCVVFITRDGGNIWQMNPDILLLAQGRGELHMIQNHVIIVEYNDKLEASECFVSHDYGKSFIAFSAGEIVFQSEVYSYGNFRGEIVSIDEAAKEITIAWNTKSPYPFAGGESNLMTAEYNFDFKLKELSYIDVDVLAHEFVSQYHQKEIFPDSDVQYLSREEVQKMLNWIPPNVPKEKVLRYAVNEIYARKGCDFSGTIYQSYFGEKNWYQNIPKCEVREEDLNPYEKANIDLLQAYEKSDD